MDMVAGNHLIATDVLNGHGDMQIDADPFFSYGGGWSVSGGVAVRVPNAATTNLSKTLVIVPGKPYQVSYTVLNYVAGTVQPTVGTTTGTVRSANGSYSEIIIAGAGTGTLLQANPAGSFQVDNWTIREVWDGTFSEGMCRFNGVSNSAQTTRKIDLTNTNKVTLLADVKIPTYDTVNTLAVYEFGVNSGTVVGTFSGFIAGATAGDPWRIITKGNVGADQGQYFPKVTKLTDRNTHLMANISNMSLSGNEGDYYQDGVYITASARVSVNNTANFIEDHLYFGGRAGTSLFSNISLANVALFDRVLSASEIADYTAWRNDMRNPHFFSLFFAGGESNVRKIRRGA